ncbi:MAG: 3-deoxy-D-manno-octulosonate cytidylyltransferase [Desulfobacteraceae bacterium 4572_88]|nr:MAG: 3-deoxy-D-manno-octulosonate cytidylyltransferase [Desulfobacteraceae bacterium 4572_88]
MKNKDTKETFPECYGIIPARYASNRFPGKPLAEILGKPMFRHVAERAGQCPELAQVALATDDERIFSVAEQCSVRAVMTRKDHPSGTDRVLEAARQLGVDEDAVVVNIQGDEPALDPAMLTELVSPFTDPDVRVTTLARKIGPEEAENPDRVKVVFAKDGRALYFSRSPIPYPRGKEGSEFYVHVGLYAFRMKVLEQFVRLGPSRLETTEKLEQLRLLENNIPIHVVTTQHQSVGVDRPEDIEIVTQLLRGAES